MKTAVLILFIAIAAAAAGYWGGLHRAATTHEPEPIAAPAAAAYVCPMHPHIVQDHPGTCPICGMDLVAAEQAADAPSQIHVDVATQQKLGVRLAAAETAMLSQDIATHGTLVADEGALLRITPNVDGVLEQLHVSHVGQRVTRGQVLYEISSQEALGLQYEYIDILRRGAPSERLAAERREQNRKALEQARDQDAATREQVERSVRQSEEQLLSILQPLERDRERVGLRLRQIGFTDDMLARLKQTLHALPRVPVRAPRACTVQEVMARPGMAVSPMTEVLRCVDASRALLEVVLYADHLSWVREGDAVTVEFENGETAKTRLSGLAPQADGAAQTLRARLPLASRPDAALGTYVSVTIHAAPRRILSVPRSAVLRTGRGSFVMRALDNGHFMPVKVLTGIENAERVAIRDGLEEGDRVAVNGQFLLDAAASIADAAQRLKND